MNHEPKPVPEPGEAHRDDNEVHYYYVDETNVGETQEPRTEDPEPAETDE